MADEIHSNQDEHIEETQPRRFSTEENESHIQPVENGNHHEDSSNIQSVDLTDNESTHSEFIQDTTSNHQESTSPLHIQPIDISDQNSFQINENSFEDTSNSINEYNQNHPVIDNDTSFQDKPNELKAQRQLDEDEIPPSELPIDQTPINDSSSESETNLIDERPLTELETPYEHSSVESSEDELKTHSFTEFVTPSENVINPITLSSFLPDVIAETIEQNEIQSEEISADENPANFTEEDFPPLPPSLNPIQPKLNDEDFPPLPSVTTKINNESILSEPQDVLGNKTLFKQTIVKGELNSHPTRSTMVTISYSLSMIDSLTSNIRLIENVSHEKYFVSENDLIPAIDICIQLMDRGERALIDSDIRHCYGDIGCEDKHIPPITTINPYRMKIELELHDWISPADIQILSIDQRLYWGDKKRQMGNFYYRRQDYKTSLQCYHGALRFLDIDNNPLLISFDQNQKSILIDRFIQVQNNLAQVYLLLNKYEDCLNAVDNVLKCDSKNIKALFRKGKALFELGKYDQAIQSLKLFIQIQKTNSNTTVDSEKANEMISICENKLANYQKNEKEIYRRMFQSTTTNSNLGNQQRQTKNTNQSNNTNNSWWPYIAVGGAALAAIGLVTFMKYRKTS